MDNQGKFPGEGVAPVSKAWVEVLEVPVVLCYPKGSDNLSKCKQKAVKQQQQKKLDA